MNALDFEVASHAVELGLNDFSQKLKKVLLPSANVYSSVCSVSLETALVPGFNTFPKLNTEV